MIRKGRPTYQFTVDQDVLIIRHRLRDVPTSWDRLAHGVFNGVTSSRSVRRRFHEVLEPQLDTNPELKKKVQDDSKPIIHVGTSWNTADEHRLMRAVARDGTNWTFISSTVFGDEKTPEDCSGHYDHMMMDIAMHSHAWSEAQRSLLLVAVHNEGYSRISWGRVSRQVPGKTASQCKKKWYFDSEKGQEAKARELKVRSMKRKASRAWKLHTNNNNTNTKEKDDDGYNHEDDLDDSMQTMTAKPDSLADLGLA